MSWTAFIDGGSRGNPGQAGAGVLLRDAGGEVAFAGGFFLGRMTNNQAEYRGLIKVLDLLEAVEADAVKIHSDSELMVRQVNGQYKVKSADLRPLFEQASSSLVRHPDWTIQHVRRERNTEADRLANQAMDARADVVLTDRIGFAPSASRVSSPPPGSSPVIRAEVIRGPGKGKCSAGIRKGQCFEFTDVTPAGLCVEACSGVIEAVCALHEAQKAGEVSEPVRCGCPRPGCQATFELSHAANAR